MKKPANERVLYPIAEEWLKRKGYKITKSDCRFHDPRRNNKLVQVDVVGLDPKKHKSVTIEVKDHDGDPRQALRQALSNCRYASLNYVLLPQGKFIRLRDLAKYVTHGIGIITLKNKKILETITAKKKVTQLNDFYTLLFSI